MQGKGRHMRFLYEAVIAPNEVGGFDARFPDLDIVTQGDDMADAVFMAQDLLQLWAAAALAAGRELPTPSFGRQAPEGGYVAAVAVECGAADPEIEVMTAQGAAETLGVSRSRVYAMARSGILESRKEGNLLLISTESVRKRFNEPRPAGRPRRLAAT